MGIDTKGLVATSCKDVLLITALAERALNRLIVDKVRQEFGHVSFFDEAVRTRFSQVTCNLNAALGMVRLNFTYDAEVRSLTIFFTCDSDYPEFGEKKIHVSMGCSGHSDLYVQTVLHALSLLGPAYFDHNDCDDLGYQPLAAAAPSVLEAKARGYLRSSDVEDWVSFFKESPIFEDKSSKGMSLVFGVSHGLLAKALALQDHSERWEAVDALAFCLSLPDLPFLASYNESLAES